MHTKLFVLFCFVGAVFAYPYAFETDFDEQPFEELLQFADDAFPVELQRTRRQVELSGGGGGSPKQGYDISIDGRAPVWKSDNGRHEVGASAGYSQHLGGPYGNSRPDYRGGASYTFRF